MKSYVALDIGGTSIKYGIVNDKGEVVNKFETPTEAHKGADNLISKVIDIIKAMLEKNPDTCGIGISTAGVVDTENGVILYANNNLPGYTGARIKEVVEQKFSIPTIVNNDVNAAAMAEYWVGAGKNKKTFFCMTIGTGIGGAIIIDGKLFKGMNFRAAEIGYMNKTSDDYYFEKAASTSALINKVKKELKVDENIDGLSIFECVKKGDTALNRIFDQWIDEICRGIANIICMFDPGIIIIGGGVSKQKDFLIDRLKKNLPKFLPESFMNGTLIEVAECGNDAGIIGAVYEFSDI